MRQPIWLVVYQTQNKNFAQTVFKKEGEMTEWIRIKILATHGTQIWTIITLIRSTTQSAKNDLRHTLKLNCNENYRHRISESVLVCSMKRIRTLSGNPRKVIRNWYGGNTSNFLEAPNNTCWINTECQLVISDNFWFLHILKFPHFNNTFLIHSSMLYGAPPETTPRTPQFLIPQAIRNTYKLCFVSWVYSLVANVAAKHLKDGSEQAADKSRQLFKSTIVVVQLRAINFEDLWLIKMQRIKWKPGRN